MNSIRMKNHKYDSLVTVFLVLVIIASIFFISKNSSNRSDNLALVYNNQTKKAVDTEFSANIFYTSVSKLMDSAHLPLEQALGMDAYYYSPYPTLINDADAATLASFGQAVNARIDMFFDLKLMTDTQLNHYIDILHPGYIELSQESQDGSNAISPSDYINLANHAISVIGSRAKTVLDGGLVYRSNQSTIDRINAVAQIQNAYGVRQYIHPGEIVHFTSNMIDNVNNLNNYFTNTATGAASLPAYLALFKQDYPNAPREVGIQWTVENASQTQYISPYAIGNSVIGRTVEFAFRNTDTIKYLSWETIGNLITGSGNSVTTSPSYTSIKRLTPLSKFTWVQPYDSGLSGVSGLLFFNDNGQTALLLNNTSGTQYSIAGSNFPNLTTAFTRDTGFANCTTHCTDVAYSWGLPATNEVVTETGSITVKPYSVSVVTFTLDQSVPPTVSITSPAANATLPVGNVTVSFTAAEGAQAIDHTELDVNNQFNQTGTSTTTSFTYNATTSGSTTFTVKAFDHDGHVGQSSVTVTIIGGNTGGGGQNDSTKTYVHLEILNSNSEASIGGQPYVYILPTNYATNSAVSTLIQNQLEHSMDVGLGRAQQDQAHFPYVYYSTGTNGVLNTFVYISARNFSSASLSTIEAWLLGVAGSWTPNPSVTYNTNAAAQKIAWLATDAGAIHLDCNDTIDNDSDGLNNYPADTGCTSASDPNENSTSSDTTAPTISSVVATPSQTSVTVTWTTNEASSSKVDYGATNYYGSTTTETDTATRVTNHSVTIAGLTANTTYHYRVKSTDAAGNMATSIDYVFTTIAANGMLSTPTITGSDPASNSSTTTTPKIIGISTSGSTVKLYTTANCTGTVAGSGSATTFASPGIQVTVVSGSITPFYATATLNGQVSSCSARFTYKAF